MTKAERAIEIFNEVAGVRAAFIASVVSELGMSPAGASTYFQNTKKKVAGEKVKHYSAKDKKSTVAETVDDSLEDAELFSFETTDGIIHSFLSQQALDQFVAAI